MNSTVRVLAVPDVAQPSTADERDAPVAQADQS